MCILGVQLSAIILLLLLISDDLLTGPEWLPHDDDAERQITLHLWQCGGVPGPLNGEYRHLRSGRCLPDLCAREWNLDSVLRKKITSFVCAEMFFHQYHYSICMWCSYNGQHLFVSQVCSLRGCIIIFCRNGLIMQTETKISVSIYRSFVLKRLN